MQKRHVGLFLLALLFLLSLTAVAQTPPVPTDLRVDTSSNRPGILLTWESSAGGRWFYRIYRSADDSMHYSLAGQTNSRRFHDVNVAAGRTYFYYVTSATVQDSTVNESGPSNVVSVTVGPTPGRAWGTIAGTVTDSISGTPVGGVRLIFFRVSSPARRLGVPQVWTDSLGQYSALLDTGTYIIRVHPQWTRIFGPSRYQTEWYNHAQTPRQATRITVADTTADTVNINLTRIVTPTMVSIRGTVTDSAGAPLEGAVVGAIRSIQDIGRFRTTEGEDPGMEGQGMNLDELGFVQGLFSRAVTDSMGAYQLQVVSDRQFILLAADSGYNPQFYNRKSSPLEADILNLTVDTSGIDFSLSAGDTTENRIVGSVRDSSGTPVPSRIVLIPLRFQAGGNPGSFGYTDSLGAFELTNVPGGRYFVLALPYAGYAPSFFKSGQTGVGEWEDADSVDISGTVTGIDIGVVPIVSEGFATVQGVAQAEGQGLQGVIVTARDSQGVIVGYGLTDNSGAYTIESLPSGQFTVTADKEGYTSDPVRTVSVQPSDFEVTGVDFTLTLVGPTAVGESEALPEIFALEQNYPNPFNPATGIRFQVPVVSHVRLGVYDILGREVAVLVNEVKQPGRYTVQFDGTGLASGTYFYRLVSGSFMETKKLMLLK